MTNDFLRRITDLFVEGKVLVLDEGIQLWIQKLNSFEVEEARRDGVAARTLRMIELASPDNSELKGTRFEVERLDDDELRDRRVEQMGDDLYLQVCNDLDSDPEWVEKLAIIRRMPALLADEGASDDDPRRTQVSELNIAYIRAIQDGMSKATAAARRELDDVPIEELREAYYEAWRQRATLNIFMAERRVTELYAAMRVCRAPKVGEGFDHSKCDHGQRLLGSRAGVKMLPDGLADLVGRTLDELTVSDRDSGNSDAPASSSASSERSSESVETSAPSTPEETSADALTT